MNNGEVNPFLLSEVSFWNSKSVLWSYDFRRERELALHNTDEIWNGRRALTAASCPLSHLLIGGQTNKKHLITTNVMWQLWLH
jgi:hypothetical protein